jgi:nucleoside-diphosphate-sugar epimerase
VIERAAALRALGDGPFALEHAPERPGEVIRSTVDPALAREVLGWEPRVGLAEGLRRTLASIRA